MVQLADGDIKTREVRGWKGLHLLHWTTSSCSQKTRIVLNLKGVPWESRLVSLRTNENFGDWFLGINPRGLVPVLVDDGAVHIESNDIIAHLEQKFPSPQLIPPGKEAEMQRLLHEEDDLHLDLRTLTMRFVLPPQVSRKNPQALAGYASAAPGTVHGVADPRRPIEIDFWNTLAREGITDAAARASATKFQRTLNEMDARLTNHRYLLGETLSLADIAWFIYAYRIQLADYPLVALHPRVGKWFTELMLRPEFAKELEAPGPMEATMKAHRETQRQNGSSLRHVMGWSLAA